MSDLQVIQTWVFTFGLGHRLQALRADGSSTPGAEGISLAHRYVKLQGSLEETRVEMNRVFGSAWAFQYESEEKAGVARHELVELPVFW